MRKEFFHLLCVVLAAMCFGAGIPRLAEGAPLGFGAIGDSLGDEYQFVPGPRNGARNYVELLTTLRGLDFGTFSAADRGEPRNQGYENNWANVGNLTPHGVTTGDLIPLGQVGGVAQQMLAGKVNLVFLTIGGNDFRSIFFGANPTDVVTQGLTNELTAIYTLQGADPNVKILVANVPDITLIPDAQMALAADPSLAPTFAALSGAIDFYNATLAAQLAGNGGVAVVDMNGILKTLIGNPHIGALTMDTLNPGLDPSNLFADGIHPGTVGQGLLANGFISAMDSQFGLNVPAFSDTELVTAAVSVPSPTGICGAIPCIVFAFSRSRRNFARSVRR